MQTNETSDEVWLKLKEGYQVQEAEAHLYHVIQEVKQFSPTTGKRVSRPVIQKYGLKSFTKVVLPSLKKQGYSLEIIHDPATWLKQKQQQTIDAQKQAAEDYQKQQNEAMQKQIAEEVEKKLNERIAAAQEQKKAVKETK